MKAVQEVSTPEISSDEKRWAAMVHLSVLSALVIPGINLIAPLIIYFTNPGGFVRAHARTVLNFWVTMVCLMATILGYLYINEGSGRDELTPLFFLCVAIVFQIITIVFYGLAGLIQASRGELIKYPPGFPIFR